MDHYIKKNITNLKPSATLAINEKVKNLLKDGKKVFNFGFGQSPFPIPQNIVDCLKNNADKKNYLPMQGLPELREAISKYLTKKTVDQFLKNTSYQDYSNSYYKLFFEIIIPNIDFD